MLTKQETIIEIKILDNGNILLSKRIAITEDDVVIATVTSTSEITNIDSHPDIPKNIKEHLKAVSDHFKTKSESSNNSLTPPPLP
jgi:inorganic pyrophosphatase